MLNRCTPTPLWLRCITGAQTLRGHTSRVYCVPVSHFSQCELDTFLCNCSFICQISPFAHKLLTAAFGALASSHIRGPILGNCWTYYSGWIKLGYLKRGQLRLNTGSLCLSSLNDCTGAHASHKTLGFYRDWTCKRSLVPFASRPLQKQGKCEAQALERRSDVRRWGGGGWESEEEHKVTVLSAELSFKPYATGESKSPVSPGTQLPSITGTCQLSGQ